MQRGHCLTNERLYESKDSREIEKGSFSGAALRWVEALVVDGDLRPQYESDFLSCGDGCSRSQFAECLRKMPGDLLVNILRCH